MVRPAGTGAGGGDLSQVAGLSTDQTQAAVTVSSHGTTQRAEYQGCKHSMTFILSIPVD